LFFWVCLSHAETVWLSSLDLTKMTAGWSIPKTNLGVMGTPLSIDGKKFTRGVGTHAESHLRVDLGGKATRFFAHVGVDDSAGTQSSIEFVVSGDGKVLWRSGLLTGGKASVPVDLKIRGVRVLVLRVRDGGDGSSHRISSRSSRCATA
jgi:alpha-galactosidase